MRKLHLYIETSVWSHWFADDTPERRDDTKIFFQQCALLTDSVILFISNMVLDELAAAPGERSKQLLSLIDDFNPIIAEKTSEADELAAAYLDHGALPKSSMVDGIHASIATIHGNGCVSKLELPSSGEFFS